MTAQIIRFPKRAASSPPKSERQKRFDRMVELIMARAARKGGECTEEKARAALTQAILDIRK